MGDEFEVEEEFETPPRKMDKASLLALYLQYRARRKLVKGDFYIALAEALLMHREYKNQQVKFQESASREIEALVAAVEAK